jgi:hypothetical protein
MSSFESNGYVLSGAEYWPASGNAEVKYPEEVLWGFYPKKGIAPPGETDKNPDDASSAAIACAEKSFAALKAFLATEPPELRRIVERGKAEGYTNKFYLWTNDYTRAATPYAPGVRSARLWYWKRKTPDPTRPPGYWKWEATVTQRGECQLPGAAQTRAMLVEIDAHLAHVGHETRTQTDPRLGNETGP